jgi:hypothetical protein
MSRRQILEMLEKGTITAEEAAQLLGAVDKGESGAVKGSRPGGIAQQDPTSVDPDQVALASSRPDAERWNRFRQIPFAIAIALLAISGTGMCLVTSRADGRITLGWIAMLLLFVFSVFATAITLWVRSAPWIHVRIEERDGKRIAISLPLPLTLAQWGLQIARPYVDERIAGHLDTSTEFLRAMRQNRGTEPLSVDIDEDGQRVQVYIG